MRKVIALGLFCFALIGNPVPVEATDGRTFESFQVAPRELLRAWCDDGATSIISHWSGAYILEIAKFSSGEISYAVYDSNEKGEDHFFWKNTDASESIEISKSAWFEKLKVASPNLYASSRNFFDLTELSHDCGRKTS